MEEGGIRLREFAMMAAAAVLAANGGAAPPPERKYRGVRRHKGNQNYSAEIRDPSGGRDGRKLWLGGYDTAVEAACVYDAAVRTLRPYDANAMTNFPEPMPEEKEKRAAVVMAYINELKQKREEEEAAFLDADAGSPEGEDLVASTDAAPAAAPVVNNASASHFPPAFATPTPLNLAFTPNPLQAQRSAFRPYRSDVGYPRQEFLTTGGCTMANVPPAQFQNLYLQFVGASGLGDAGGSDPGTDAGMKAPRRS